MTLIPALLPLAKVRVSSIPPDSPLGKAAAKAESIADSEEECGCRQGLLQQRQVRRERWGSGRDRTEERNLLFRPNNDLICIYPL